VPSTNRAGVCRFEKMLGAELCRFARRVERIGQEKQAGSERRFRFRLFGTHHARLPSAIGVATEEDGAGRHILQGSDRILQSGTIAFTIVGSRRPVKTDPDETADRSAAQESPLRQNLRQSQAIAGLAIRSRAGSQNQSLAGGAFGTMQKTAHEWVDRYVGINSRA